MLICDTHADTIGARTGHWNDGRLDVTLENLTLTADTRVQTMALFIPPDGMKQSPTIVEKQLAEFERMKLEGFHQIRSLGEAVPGRANVLLSIEGGEAFGDCVEGVDFMDGVGVRLAAITWNTPNELCQPALTGNDTGLKPLGRAIVRRMHEKHMGVDVSHLNERGFWDLMDMGTAPLASHSCVWNLCPNERNLKDDQIRALIEAQGFIGINFYTGFLNPDMKADLDTVVDHMAYICDMGGENCVGFGSDFDGIDDYPIGLRTAADVPNLIAQLMKRGFGEKLTEKIAGLNFKRYLENI
ncbi:MAG: membrane dipeptidase [Clostridia bacterium]|nr:membrane dipeptidase [Clostridia bacterium]